MSAVPEIEQLQAELGPGTPVEQLTAAARLAEALRARGQELLDHLVDAARADGASWSEIGCSLDTSKQAAQERFAALADPPPGETPFGLNGAAAVVLSTAGEQARGLGHHYIRPEHLVLGLLAQPEELAGIALADLNISAEKARAEIEARLGTAAPRPTGSLGVAPQTKRLLELARTIARRLGHRCPRTEHLLLAAVSPKLQSPAAGLLDACGTSPDGVREHVTRLILEQAPELADRLTGKSLLVRIKTRIA